MSMATQQDSQQEDLIFTTNGTVTLVPDETEGVVRVYAEQEPDMADWREALAHLRRLGSAGTVTDSYADGATDVFEVRMLPAS